MTSISDIRAFEVLDSRGNPTVAAEVRRWAVEVVGSC